MMPQQFSRGGSYDPRDEQIHEMRTQMAAMQLRMIEKDVAVIIDDLAKKVVIDPIRDTATLLRMSAAEQQAEIQHWITTRRAVDPPAPVRPVYGPNDMVQIPGDVGGGPMQMSLQQAQQLAMIGVPADPAMTAAAANGQKNRYDMLQDIVRNRGRGVSTLDAYEAAMAPSRPANVTPLMK